MTFSDVYKILCATRDSRPLFIAASRSQSGGDRSPTTIKASLPRNSSEVFRQLHSILMGQRCCVSSPITRNPFIMSTSHPTDLRVNFSGVHSVLTLVVHKDNKGLAGMIMEKMHTLFISDGT
jgi:hypothetical protein